MTPKYKKDDVLWSIPRSHNARFTYIGGVTVEPKDHGLTLVTVQAVITSVDGEAKYRIGMRLNDLENNEQTFSFVITESLLFRERDEALEAIVRRKLVC